MAPEPPTPTNVLRGHRVPVHYVGFIWGNSRLISGDADGWIIIWDIATLRPTGVWKAHGAPLLGIKSWRDMVITHARDNELSLWKVGPEQEENLQRYTPLEEGVFLRPPPPLDVTFPVNSMNFCTFAACSELPGRTLDESDRIWVAVPNAISLEGVDIYCLPSQTRQHVVNVAKKAGMVMAISLGHVDGKLAVATGYENGQCTVAVLSSANTWSLVYSNTSHSQPILALEISPCSTYFVTSGTDAIIAKHPFPRRFTVGQVVTESIKAVNTKHAGQQGLSIRLDGKVFATAGWDSKARLYSGKTMKEVAVLKWHSEGTFCTAFSNVATIEWSAKEQENDQRHGRDGTDEDGEDQVAKVETVKERRLRKAYENHWVAVGSKDGRISLWNLF